MSIFTRARENREKAKEEAKVAEEKYKSATMPPEQQAPPSEEDLPPVPVPPPSMMQKVTTKEVVEEVKEELMELSDDERREFVFIFKEKHDTLLKDMQDIIQKIDDLKFKDKQNLDEAYRIKTKEIDEKYEKQKDLIEERYADNLARYNKLIEKFQLDGGTVEYGEDKVPEKVSTPTPPGPKIDTIGLDEKFHPEISGILKEIDKKHS